jgi:hypothetical protein
VRLARRRRADGARDEDAIILIVGEGPAANTRVEEAKYPTDSRHREAGEACPSIPCRCGGIASLRSQ